MLQFYTDIAHELKTPLSLITAPVEELLLNPAYRENDAQQTGTRQPAMRGH